MIFSKNFLEGHGPPDISVGRGVGKRGITPSLDSGGGGVNPRFYPPLDLLRAKVKKHYQYLPPDLF